MTSQYYTFDGVHLHRKIERAARRALNESLDPEDLHVLEDGRFRPALEWEIDELELYMRDQSCT